MIVDPCLSCQTRIEFYEDEISAKFDSNFEMPVVYYGQLTSVACGRSVEDSAADDQLVKAGKLEEVAAK